MPTVLIIDDEVSILHAFRRALRDPDVTVVTAASAAEGLEQLRHRPDVILLDINLPDLSGLEAFRRIRQLDARIPVIFITGHGTTDTAIEAMKLGAYDYLLKPLELPEVREKLARAFEISRLMHVPAVLPAEEKAPGPSDVLVGRCPAMQEVYKAIGRVASQDVTVLLHGESGTGKELVARAIYQHSRRAAGPFLALNCAAIPENLLESELFGHEKGAFTGADSLRRGRFEQADGGTLFLDEIGDLPLGMQAKLLRVLQDQHFERVGGGEPIKADCRVIAATNLNLAQAVAENRFREDLYYRLNVVSIDLPPLRERLEDVSLLVNHFLGKLMERGLPDKTVARETLSRLLRYDWPGNVRELEHIIEQAVVTTPGPLIEPENLPPQIVPLREEPFSLDFDQNRPLQDLTDEFIGRIERAYLIRVLEKYRGRIDRCALHCGLSRRSISEKLRRYQIDKSDFKPAMRGRKRFAMAAE
jgi:two-component system, NtrC family, response regulator AtoC